MLFLSSWAGISMCRYLPFCQRALLPFPYYKGESTPEWVKYFEFNYNSSYNENNKKIVNYKFSTRRDLDVCVYAEGKWELNK